MLSIQKREWPHMVTLYRLNGDKSVTRTVIGGFMDFRKNKSVDKTGSHEVNSFLLLVPPCDILPGDKILFGVGAETIDWAQFIPSKVKGLVVARYVDPKYLGNKLHHLEIGG